MIFISLLFLTTIAIAGSAAFFSVVGLAATFSGTFWSVVVMGSSLEAGKLVAASYLYRQWATTNLWLKAYLMSGILALMVLTSTGIFGYLSSGYQSDVLPLKQIEEQVKLLEGEKVRLIARKSQIDDQIAKLPDTSVSGRVKLIKGFKDEQKLATERISELDKVILTEKQKLIQTQAHIGPITYIAAAFSLDTDNATKYLIYLIIFAFDPMALALTIAVNISIRLREEEKEKLRQLKMQQPVVEQVVEPAAPIVPVVPVPVEVVYEEPEPEPVVIPPSVNVSDVVPEPEVEPVVEPEVIEEPKVEPEPEVIEEPVVEEFVEEPVVEEFVEDPVIEEPVVEEPRQVKATRRRTRPYSSISNAISTEKLDELVQHYQWLNDKVQNGEPLTQDDKWEMTAIEDILRKNGLGMYIS